MRPEVIRDQRHWRDALDGVRARGRSVGLVPTMGALHAGHLSLVRKAAAECDLVALTNYVNPLQFGSTDDLAAYPRDEQRDFDLAEEAGAELVFAPSQAQMWPEPPQLRVHPEGISGALEGASRPGHFDGVALIVAKLLGLAGPCYAYFGEKDYQQVLVVRRLVADLSLPAVIVACPTVRHHDGLAMSSRNAYLSARERAVAPKIYWSLLAGKRAVEEQGETDPSMVSAAMAAVVAGEELFELDYAAVADPVDLHCPDHIAGEVRLLVAARLGKARLIDNIAASAPASRDSAPGDGVPAPGTAAVAKDPR